MYGGTADRQGESVRNRMSGGTEEALAGGAATVRLGASKGSEPIAIAEVLRNLDTRPLIACVVGTRPEAVKMAPVVLRLRQPGSEMRVRLISTGQHRELLARALADFGLAADVDLDLMRPDQDLADLTARALTALARAIDIERPDLVLAQGDTTTVLAAALASYYRRIPFGHVEAGLRTGDPYAPFPEEKNRELAGHLAQLHFAPTPTARANLLREGIDPATIHVTGNSVVDALRMMAARDPAMPVEPATPKFALVTAHRRENFGEPLRQIGAAVLDLIDRDPTLSVVWPVHPNPAIGEGLRTQVGGRERIRLIQPVGYPEMVALMRDCSFILTDSGGIQEEAPSLGKPILVLRDTTERPEAVEAGVVKLVGPHREAIVRAVIDLERMPWAGGGTNPYGDGYAAERIARILSSRFGVDPGPIPAGFSTTWQP